VARWGFFFAGWCTGVHVSSKGSYLPKRATIDEATHWLEEATGESWPLGRLLDHGGFLRMGVWLRPDERTPPEVLRDVFKKRAEGFWAPLCFASDVSALMADRTLVMTMTRIVTGELVTFTPGLCFALADLRIEGGSLQGMVESIKPENKDIIGWVRVATGVRELEFSDLAWLMADALASPTDNEIVRGARVIQFESELDRLVDAGKVPLRNPLTGGLQTFRIGRARKTAVIRIHDLRELLAEHYSLGVLVDGTTDSAPNPASEAQAVPVKRQRFEIPPRVEHVPQDLLKLGRDTEVLYASVGRPGASCEQVVKAFQLVEMLEGIIDRQAKGRYSLSEAAGILAGAEGGDPRDLLNQLKRAAITGVLPVHQSGSNLAIEDLKYPLVLIDEVFKEAYWDDLNVWLGIHHKRTTYRFPMPVVQTPNRLLKYPAAKSTPDGRDALSA
jgi:hypothetical protein